MDIFIHWLYLLFRIYVQVVLRIKRLRVYVCVWLCMYVCV